MAEESYRVTLNVYDLSQGLARQLSSTFLGKTIEGVWHTGVVVYGNEYYFGAGIHHEPVGKTPYGTPIKVVDLGVTHVPQEVFEAYLQEISPRYTPESYSLLHHNCNNFSNEVVQFLVGVNIPEYILQLPNEVMSSPMGALILPMIQNLEATLKAGAVPQVPQFSPRVMQPASIGIDGTPNSPNRDVPKTEEQNTPASVPPPTKPAEASDKPPVNGVAGDPLGDARNKVQEEISREFMAIMATGTLRASEAAALATRRVMEKYGFANVAA